MNSGHAIKQKLDFVNITDLINAYIGTCKKERICAKIELYESLLDLRKIHLFKLQNLSRAIDINDGYQPL